MTRWNYFLKRLLLMIPVLFLVMTALFIILRLGPIDPVAARLGPEASGAAATRMRQKLGLNDPLWKQYLDYVTNLITLNLGESWVVRADYDVWTVIRISGPVTLWLGFWAIMLPLFIGIPLGMYAGLNPNSWGDYIASLGGILWLAMPNFWLAVMILAFLRASHGGSGLPMLGWFDWYTLGPNIDSMVGTPDLNFYSAPFTIHWGNLASDIKFILPPALILGSASMAAESRIGRTAMLETANSNYIETAKAKGVRDRVIVWKHMFRNALIPLLPVITNEAFLLIGGSVIIEQIFNINGIGNIFFLAITQGDMPLAGGLLFFFTLIILGLNILQDFLFTIIDPRVGYDQ